MSRQLICNFVRCQTINESLINVSNDFRLLRNNLRQTAFAFSIAQKVSIGQTNFPVSKPFSLSPCDIFRNRTAFLLSQRTHNGDEQFAFTIKSPNIFLFKETFHMMFFQFSDSCQAVNRISSEPTYTFCDNQVDFSVQSIRNHGIKALSMFRRCCGNALICIYFNKLPIRISLNVIGIVRNLCLIAGELFLEIGGNSGVGSDFSACWS